MTRTTSLLIALGLAAAACGTAATDVGSQDPAPAATEATSAATQQSTTQATEGSAATTPPETTATSESAQAPALVAEGPAAPNFTLALADGSTYELASAERPVMLVFWAEW